MSDLEKLGNVWDNLVKNNHKKPQQYHQKHGA